MTIKTQRTIVAFCQNKNDLNKPEELHLAKLLGEHDYVKSLEHDHDIYISTLDFFTKNQDDTKGDNFPLYCRTKYYIKFITYNAEMNITYSQ